MGASDYFPDLPEFSDIVEHEFRGHNYRKITFKGVTVHRGMNLGKDDEPGSPTFGQDVIIEGGNVLPK